VQAEQLDDDGGVESVGWWVVGEPGGSERLGAAEVGVANGERKQAAYYSFFVNHYADHHAYEFIGRH